MERFARLLPDRAEGLTAATISRRPCPARRPTTGRSLLANMIATADGRATIAGRTAPIANRADYELFHALRARVDAVMVGAETVRVESYGPMEPAAVLVTRSADVPADVGLLRAPDNRVVVLTPSPDADARRPPRRRSATCARRSRRACGGCGPSSASAPCCARAARGCWAIWCAPASSTSCTS